MLYLTQTPLCHFQQVTRAAVESKKRFHKINNSLQKDLKKKNISYQCWMQNGMLAVTEEEKLTQNHALIY